MNKQFEAVNAQLAEISERMNIQFTAIDSRFNTLEQKVDTLFEAFSDVRSEIVRVLEHERRIESLENGADLTRTLLLDNNKQLNQQARFIKRMKKATTS